MDRQNLFWEDDAMLKMIVWGTRIFALLSFLAAVPIMMRVAQLGKTLARANSTMAQMQKGDLAAGENEDAASIPGLDGLTGQGSEVGILQKVLGISKEEVPATKVAEEEPQKPSTVIRYNESEEGSGKKSPTSVLELPPGACAIVIDGKLQIYYPHGKPK
jgi:hypothetical protein